MLLKKKGTSRQRSGKGNIFENPISLSSVIFVVAANAQCLNGNRRQNGQNIFKAYPGSSICQRIVSVVTSPVVQRETNVLTDNVYLTSRKINVRIPVFHS